MHSQNEKQKENSNDRLFEYSCVMVSKKKKKGGGGGGTTFAKRLGPCQPALSTQADMGKDVLLSLNFERDTRTIPHHNSIGCLTK